MEVLDCHVCFLSGCGPDLKALLGRNPRKTNIAIVCIRICWPDASLSQGVGSCTEVSQSIHVPL